MILKMIKKWKCRHLRMKIWQKRLHHELQQTLSQTAWKTSFNIKLHTSWGPFYNGSAWYNPTRNEATILVQLPYDRFLTDEEKKVLKTYSLPLSSLPYFILNHELYHLMDILSDVDEQKIKQRVKENQRLTGEEDEYRQLSFEYEADRFAYRCYREKKQEAC